VLLFHIFKPLLIFCKVQYSTTYGRKLQPIICRVHSIPHVQGFKLVLGYFSPIQNRIRLTAYPFYTFKGGILFGKLTLIPFEINSF